MTAGSKAVLKAVLLITASVGLSGCVYDVGLGYASDGYYDDGYGCDPYGGYDAYYDCDYGQGFANIGFGGGYYDNFYYPGYGFFLFDNVGRRYPMRDHHRRYWGEKRQGYFREQRGRDRDGRRYDGRQRGYSNDVSQGQNSRPKRQSGRVSGGVDASREGIRGRNDQWRDSQRVRVNGSSLGRIPEGQRSLAAERVTPVPRVLQAFQPDGVQRAARRSPAPRENVRDK